MDPGDRHQELTGTWVRSAEEETGPELVFRPPGHPFPPARAPRPALRLEPDGTVVALAGGPSDRPEVQPGTGHWSRPHLSLSLATAHLSGEFTLELVAPDRLLLRPRPEHADQTYSAGAFDTPLTETGP